MVAPTNANPTISLNLPGYDPAGNQVNVAIQLANITTDPDTGVVYGNLALGTTTPGTGATNLGKAENASWSQGDVGVALLAARNDAFTSLTTADGRYSFIKVDEFGRIESIVGGLLDRTTGISITSATGMYINPYPSTATPITASSGNVANAAAVATLAGTSGKTTYISGFQLTGSGATLGLPVTVTVAGLISGTNSYTYSAIAGVLLSNTPLIIQFDPPVAASAVNTAIVVTCPALGAGNTNSTVSAQGYQL